MTTATTIDVRAFIDEQPISPYQWLLVALCFPVVVADGMDVAIMDGTLVHLTSVSTRFRLAQRQVGMRSRGVPH